MISLTRRGLGRVAAAMAAGTGLAACDRDLGAEPEVEHADLAPFDPGRPTGGDTGLPHRCAWANTGDSEIFVALSTGMRDAAQSHDVEYLTANAAGDPARNVAQIETFLTRGVGAVGVQPLDQAAQQQVLQRAIDRGTCVMGIITAPTVLQVSAAQYEIGHQQGKAAADHIVRELGGQAEVVYFNQDNIAQQLRVRHRGVLDGLATGGDGIRVVADLAMGDGATIEAGFNAMVVAFQEHPRVSVVMGGETFVLGAYRAAQQLQRLGDDMYFSGVDGTASALELIRQGTPYRASHAFSWRLMGYAMGRFAVDWIEGLSIPRIMIATTTLVDSPEKVTAYREVNENAATIYEDLAAYAEHVPLLGNVSFEERAHWRGAYEP